MAVKRTRTLTRPDLSTFFWPPTSDGEYWAMGNAYFYKTMLDRGILLYPDAGYVSSDMLSFTQLRFYRDEAAIQELTDIMNEWTPTEKDQTLILEHDSWFETNGITVTDTYDFEFIMPTSYNII